MTKEQKIKSNELFIEELEQKLRELKISQRRLCIDLGFTQNTISDWRNGEHQIREHTKIKIRQYLKEREPIKPRYVEESLKYIKLNSLYSDCIQEIWNDIQALDLINISDLNIEQREFALLSYINFKVHLEQILKRYQKEILNNL